jgi:hypothetical protein
MRRLLAAVLTSAALLALASRPLAAQAVETPEPFDSAGRVEAITPGMAAQLELRPPAWRIAGDYREARLYRLTDSAYVVAVTRRNGVVERYAITAEDRQYLRERASALPPTVREQLVHDVGEAARSVTDRATRNAFVRNQSLLGLGVYAPAFAAAVTDDAAGRVASYLLVAGGTYFGAATLTREMAINESMNRMATDLALRTAAGGLGIAYALGAPEDGRAASIFVGGLAGTAAGLWLGRDVTPAQIEAAGFASTAAALTAGATHVLAIDADNVDDDFPRELAATLVLAGAAGYPIGLVYPKRVSYNVTAGDINTLWATGALGIMAAGTTVANGDVEGRPVIAATLAGFLGGVIAGDRLLVKRFDHSRSEANMVLLGTGAGALMGAGVFVLVDRDRENSALALGLATAGGIAGIAATEYFLMTKADAGRLSSRLQLNPAGLAMAAGRVPGRHPLLTFSF